MSLTPGTRLGRTVAIKVLPPDAAADAAARARFEREVRAIAALSHRHRHRRRPRRGASRRHRPSRPQARQRDADEERPQAARLRARETGAAYPFWSPDGRSVGFFADGKLRKIDIAGGPPTTVGAESTSAARGGSWGNGDTIVFAPSVGPIMRVPAAGGVPVPVSRLDPDNGEGTHRWPQLLPDGRHLLYFVRSSKPHRTGLYLGSLDDPDKKAFLVETATTEFTPRPTTVRAGHLLWIRDGALMSQVFDPETGRLSGDVVPVTGAEHVGTVGALSGSPVWVFTRGHPRVQ